MDGGVDQGPWLQERVGGAVGAMANFATCVVFLSFLTCTKRRKMAFFEGCPVGWGGGVPTGAGLVDGGVDQDSRGRGQGRVGLAGKGGCTHRRISQRVSYLSFLTPTKRRKMAFFEGCPVGWGEALCPKPQTLNPKP